MANYLRENFTYQTMKNWTLSLCLRYTRPGEPHNAHVHSVKFSFAYYHLIKRYSLIIDWESIYCEKFPHTRSGNFDLITVQNIPITSAYMVRCSVLATIKYSDLDTANTELTTTKSRIIVTTRRTTNLHLTASYFKLFNSSHSPEPEIKTLSDVIRQTSFLYIATINYRA